MTHKIAKYLSIILLFVALGSALFAGIPIVLVFAVEGAVLWADIWEFMKHPMVASISISTVAYLLSKLLRKFADEMETDGLEDRIAKTAHHTLYEIQQIHQHIQTSMTHIDRLLRNVKQLAVIILPPHDPSSIEHFADTVAWLNANNKEKDAKKLLEMLPMATFKQVREILTTQSGVE